MAEELNIPRHFYHPTKGLEHYDIPARRISELQPKTELVSSKALVKVIQEYYGRTNFRSPHIE
jgi:hypothetical protein